MEKVKLVTSDGINIAGNHYKGSQGSPGVALLHMMPSDKSSWSGFATKLNEAGFGALAIDLRGHGESDGGPGGFNSFSDSEHQKSVEDVRASVDFQIAEGHSKIFLVGASIGANLALRYLVESERVSAAALLSAGLNYKGIESVPLAKNVRSGQGVFLIASKDDRIKGADSMAEKIYAESGGIKRRKIFDSGGHGTELFDSHPDLMDEIINWFKEF